MLWFMSHISKGNRSQASRLMHFFPLVMESQSFSYILILSPPVAFCHWSTYKMVLSLCLFMRLTLKKQSVINLPHDSSQVHQVPSMSWRSSVLVLCSVAYSLKSHKGEVLHGLLDSLPPAGQSSWGTGEWAAGCSQTETSCWVILDAKSLLKGPEFMKWRNSILWQCTRRGSVFLRFHTDCSCEDRIHSCFHTQGREISICFLLTFVSDCGMHWGLPHTALASDTSLSESRDDKPQVSGHLRYFPYVRFHFWSDILILRADKILSGFSGSLFAEPEDLGLFWDPLSWDIPSHAG